MISFKQFISDAENLSEVADKKVEYEVTTNSNSEFIAKTQINGRSLRFKAFNTNDDDDGWDIEFEEFVKAKEPGGSGRWTTSASGSGGEFEVAAFIVAAIKDLIKRHDPNVMSFVAMKNNNEKGKNTRAAVYERLIKRHFPEFEIEHFAYDGKITGSVVSTFRMRKLVDETY